MAKRSIASSARGKRAKGRRKSTPGNKIDFSDIPELTNSQLKQMKRLGRPLLGETPRQLIAIRIDGNILEKLKAEAEKNGIGYQSLINEILDDFLKRSAA